jgi:hypothetical protein
MAFKLVRFILHHDCGSKLLCAKKKRAEQETRNSRKEEEQDEEVERGKGDPKRADQSVGIPVAVSVTNHFIPSDRPSNLIYFHSAANGQYVIYKVQAWIFTGSD